MYSPLIARALVEAYEADRERALSRAHATTAGRAAGRAPRERRERFRRRRWGRARTTVADAP